LSKVRLRRVRPPCRHRHPHLRSLAHRHPRRESGSPCRNPSGRSSASRCRGCASASRSGSSNRSRPPRSSRRSTK
jgi:hypothetical protein